MIAFIDYNLVHADATRWDADHIISRYCMMEERTKEFGPKTIFAIFAEIRRFTKSLDECHSELDYLLYWFRYGWGYKELPGDLDRDGFIKDLAEACAIAGFTPEKLQEYRNNIMTERDIIAQRMYAEEQGFERGQRKNALDTAANLLAEGLDAALIARCTGLSLDEVKALAL